MFLDALHHATTPMSISQVCDGAARGEWPWGLGDFTNTPANPDETHCKPLPPHMRSAWPGIKSAHVTHMCTHYPLGHAYMLCWQPSISLVFRIGIRVLQDMALLTHQVSHAQADWCITPTQPDVVTMPKLSSIKQVHGRATTHTPVSVGCPKAFTFSGFLS